MVRERERDLSAMCFYRENFCIKVTIPAPFILLVITPLELVLLLCVCVTIGFEQIGNNMELYYVRMRNYDNGKRPTREKRKITR